MRVVYLRYEGQDELSELLEFETKNEGNKEK
jgi:hypothetical protein